MKKLLFVFLSLPVLSFSQECKVKKSTDPFNHETKLSTGFSSFNNGPLKLSVSADATAALLDFFFWVQNEGVCFDNNSTAAIIFEGEKYKMSFKNSGSMNCEGAFHFSFKNTATPNSQLNKIATKKISTIKLIGNNKAETLITLTEDQKTQLMNMASCIITEGKTLLKP